MAKSLICKIITPEKTVFEGAAEMVVVPAHDGELGILKGHAGLVAKLSCGECRIVSGASTTRFYVEGGIVKVRTTGAEEGSRTEAVLLTEVSLNPSSLKAVKGDIEKELQEARNLKITDDGSFDRRQKAIQVAERKLEIIQKA